MLQLFFCISSADHLLKIFCSSPSADLLHFLSCRSSRRCDAQPRPQLITALQRRQDETGSVHHKQPTINYRRSRAFLFNILSLCCHYLDQLLLWVLGKLYDLKRKYCRFWDLFFYLFGKSATCSQVHNWKPVEETQRKS